MDVNNKPLSIEQAGNFLKEKVKTMPEDTKKEAKKQPISVAPTGDRIKYLMYGITILTDVSEAIKNRWCNLTEKSTGMYSTKEVCQMLRRILVLRINGYTIKNIAHHLKATEVEVLQSESLAVAAIKENIEKKKDSGIPILGGARG